MAVKLNKKQAEKVEKIRQYLATEIGQGGALIDDCEYTYIFNLRNVWVDACGIRLFGSDVHNKSTRDLIYPTEIHNLFSAIKRGDEDFVNFLKGE